MRELPPEEPPPPERKEEPAKEPEPVKEVKPEVEAQAQTVTAAEETFASRDVGVVNGLKRGGGMTRAAYAAAVKKQIDKNRRRPVSQGHGVVGVNFLIGPAGKVDRTTIIRSLSPALDETARSIVASIRVPPPPDGRFEATVRIEFR